MTNTFYWGGAIAANQAEGAWNVDGRGMTMTDITTGGSRDKFRELTFIDKDGKPGHVIKYAGLPKGSKGAVLPDYYYPNHEAIDFYHHYKEDIALFAEMGFQMFRMSIAWSRIFPNGTDEKVNEKGIQFYHNVFKELKKYNIEPLVTLLHFDLPLALEEKGGWNERSTIDAYERYVKTVLLEYKDEVTYWLTINEINLQMAFCSMESEYNTNEKRIESIRQQHHQLVACARAVKIAHAVNPNNKVGCMEAAVISYPGTCDPKDIINNYHRMQEALFYSGDVMCFGEYPKYATNIWNKYNAYPDITRQDIVDLKEGKVDFYTFSYYNSSIVTSHKSDEKVSGNLSSGDKNPYIKYSEWGWGMDPDGLQYILEVLDERYKIPLMIVENGLGTNDIVEDGKVHDQGHILYLKEHIKAIQNAMHHGANVIGYLPWGCIDIVSASSGEMRKRYGFIYVDRDDEGNGTFQRIKKDSFEWYKKVIASNGKDLD